MAYLVMTWIIGFDSLREFGVYCSDVSGAFDRVSRHRLLRKLRAKGLHDVALGFLASWLQSRTAHVVVEGATSGAMALDHMVFQGTVWGPPLRFLLGVHTMDMWPDARRVCTHGVELTMWSSIPARRVVMSSPSEILMG